ncbi:MAG: phosphocarrier protein HPr [Acidobacteria bacterium]|nr:MAG: phosphocarrier protein HPr [Acidobacteriota bacterium]PIE90704.1 MAG: phosphocarrier protein HPr [Acidobacteriota bacterium]
MIENKVEIVNQKGLHARAAAKLINLSHTFESEILIQKGDNEVNGKSILGLLMLAAQMGSLLTVKADGPDEKKALDAVCNLISNKFEENK